MSDQAEDIDVLIEDYLEGRMDAAQRSRFEDRVNKDVALKERVNLATHSAALVQQALGWLTPGDEFDDKVTSKIMSITQSGQNLRPPVSSSGGALTSNDPDAKLLEDPEAKREQRRLLILGIVAAVLFAMAAGAIGYSIAQGMRAEPAVGNPPKN